MRRIRLAALLLALWMQVSPARAGECAGISMPERLSVGGAELRLNGLGLREVTMLGLDVYVAGLYLPKPERNAQRILAADAPRQMRLQLLRDVPSADMASNIEAGFRRAAGSAFSQHEGNLRRLIALLPPLATGDIFALTVVPGSGVRVEHGSRVLGTLSGDEFARVLFAIWLGEPPLSAPLKAGLLGAPCPG